MRIVDGKIIWDAEELEEVKKVEAFLDECRKTRAGEDVCMGIDEMSTGVHSDCRSCQFWAGYDPDDGYEGGDEE